MATIFPDVEKLVVGRLKAALTASEATVASDVTVATKKPGPKVTPYPSKIVTVRGDGGSDTSRGLVRSELVGINIYADTYARASDLARLVESFMRSANSGEIKLVETVTSPVRIDNDGPEEQRYCTFRVFVKASDV